MKLFRTILFFITLVTTSHLMANDKPIERRVTCVLKDDNENITHIGGDWGITSAEEAIIEIQNKEFKYYVDCNGKHKVKVKVKKGKNGLYLKSRADGRKCNNLDHQPSCDDNA